jgi:hypothetical protein
MNDAAVRFGPVGVDNVVQLSPVMPLRASNRNAHELLQGTLMVRIVAVIGAVPAIQIGVVLGG